MTSTLNVDPVIFGIKLEKSLKAKETTNQLDYFFNKKCH